MAKKKRDIKTFSLEELQKDLGETIWDTLVCEAALNRGLGEYSGGSVKNRLAVNQGIRGVIEKEMRRRIAEPEVEEAG